jgi:hypothetical protein
MDKISSLNLSLDKILIQLIIPALVALCPYLLLVFHCPDIKNYWLNPNNIALFITCLVIIGLIIGMILENIGSFIELKFYDKLNEKSDDKFNQIWEAYLLLNFEHEPIGNKYIKTILSRMKFELSFGIALIIATLGTYIYNWNYSIFGNDSCIFKISILLIIEIVIAGYFIYEGYQSSKVLAKTRKILVAKFAIPPIG